MDKNIENSVIYKNLGKNIKELRFINGLSQEKLAELINKSPHYISMIERGSCGAHLSTIVAICNVLKVDANTIFNGIINKDLNNKNSYILNSLTNFDKNDKNFLEDLINYINIKNDLNKKDK